MQKFLLLPEPWDLDKVCKQNNLLQQFVLSMAAIKISKVVLMKN